MAQVYVNSGLVKPRSIHIYNSSAQLWEEDRIGYVRVNGEWMSFIEYDKWLYQDGIEIIPLVQGYGGHPFRWEKESEFMKIYKVSGNTGQLGFVTDMPINLTNYTTLKIEWESFASSTDIISSLIVSSEKMGASHNYDAVLDEAKRTPKQIDTLDVTSFSGEYFIRVHLFDRTRRVDAELNVYKLWLE